MCHRTLRSETSGGGVWWFEGRSPVRWGVGKGPSAGSSIATDARVIPGRHEQRRRRWWNRRRLRGRTPRHCPRLQAGENEGNRKPCFSDAVRWEVQYEFIQRFFKTRLGERFRESDNLVARLNLPNMRYDPEQRARSRCWNGRSAYWPPLGLRMSSADSDCERRGILISRKRGSNPVRSLPAQLAAGRGDPSFNHFSQRETALSGALIDRDSSRREPWKGWSGPRLSGAETLPGPGSLGGSRPQAAPTGWALL